MNQIFVSHEPRGVGIDLRPLYQYAKEHDSEVQFVFGHTFNVGQHPKEALAAAETFASKFDFKNDLWLVVGGDPLAGIICMVALVHEAIAARAPSVNSLRYIRERDETGARTVPRYVEITIPTGVR